MTQNWGSQTPDDQTPDFNPFVPQQQYDPFQQQMPQMPVDLTWSEVWEMVLSDPSEQTFQTILRDVNASTTRGLTWVLIAGFVGGVVNVLAQAVFGLAFFPLGFGNSEFFTFSLIVGIILIPILAVLTIIGFVVGTFLIHLGASMMGGKGRYDALSYAFSSFYAPLSIIASVIGFIPCLGALAGIGIFFYELYMSFVAVKTVHGFGWFQAVMSVILIPFVFFVLFVCCFALVIGPALGTAVNDVFNSLMTATP